MSVYVDNARNRYGRMLMCHMLADSVEELHKMAKRLGLKRAWFQPLATPHYDICQSRRRVALSLGAKSVDRFQLVYIIKKLRGKT